MTQYNLFIINTEYTPSLEEVNAYTHYERSQAFGGVSAVV